MPLNKEFNIFYTDDDLEDIEFFREVAEEIDGGTIIHTYATGNKLLDALENPPPAPSLLFLDLNMPGLTGFDVLTKLRSSEAFKKLPIIIFSTSSDDKTIAITKKLGANFYVTKSSNFTVYRESIEYVLGIDWKTFIPTEENFVYSA